MGTGMALIVAFTNLGLRLAFRALRKVPLALLRFFGSTRGSGSLGAGLTRRLQSISFSGEVCSGLLNLKHHVVLPEKELHKICLMGLGFRVYPGPLIKKELQAPKPKMKLPN